MSPPSWRLGRLHRFRQDSPQDTRLVNEWREGELQTTALPPSPKLRSGPHRLAAISLALTKDSSRSLAAAVWKTGQSPRRPAKQSAASTRHPLRRRAQGALQAAKLAGALVIGRSRRLPPGVAPDADCTSLTQCLTITHADTFQAGVICRIHSAYWRHVYPEQRGTSPRPKVKRFLRCRL